MKKEDLMNDIERVLKLKGNVGASGGGSGSTEW